MVPSVFYFGHDLSPAAKRRGVRVPAYLKSRSEIEVPEYIVEEIISNVDSEPFSKEHTIKTENENISEQMSASVQCDLISSRFSALNFKYDKDLSIFTQDLMIIIISNYFLIFLVLHHMN